MPRPAAILLMVCTLGLSLVQCENPTFLPLSRPNIHQLTTDAYYYQAPRWSPDGTQIAFYIPGYYSEHNVVLTMNSDGSHMGPLTGLAMDNLRPDWSPDGKKLVFASNHLNVVQLYVMKDDGSDKRQLTNFDQLASCPKWSPDGKRIAFCGWTGKTLDDYEIYVMNADGTNIDKLTHYPLGQIEFFDWSPDSTQIVFVAENVEAKKAKKPQDEIGPFLYVMNSDGSSIRRLNDGIPGLYFPTWSPDGKQILFEYYGVGSEINITDGFYLTNLEGSGRRLVLGDATCDDPNWSRANNKLVFVCGRWSFNGQIFTLDMNNAAR